MINEIIRKLQAGQRVTISWPKEYISGVLNIISDCSYTTCRSAELCEHKFVWFKPGWSGNTILQGRVAGASCALCRCLDPSIINITVHHSELQVNKMGEI